MDRMTARMTDRMTDGMTDRMTDRMTDAFTHLIQYFFLMKDSEDTTGYTITVVWSSNLLCGTFIFYLMSEGFV